MGIKITNGNTSVKYINIWIGKIHLSFTYFDAFKVLWKTVVAVIVVVNWVVPAYYKAETIYYNIQKIPDIIQTVDSTKLEFKDFKNTVQQKWKSQDSLIKIQ